MAQRLLNLKRISILFYVLAFLISSANCNFDVKKESPPTKDNTTIKAELITVGFKNKFDSVFVYKDVNWVSLTGLGEKKSSTIGLTYPVSLFAYKDNVLKIFVYFSEKDVVVQCLVSLINKYDFSYCFYYSTDARDTLIKCSYFLSNRKRLDFLTDGKSFNSKEFSFSGFTVWEEDSASNCLISSYMSSDYSGKKYHLSDCINEISSNNSLPVSDVFQVEKFKIEGARFLKFYDKRVDKYNPEENWERSKTETQYENINTPSFFYHYAKIFSYCTCGL